MPDFAQPVDLQIGKYPPKNPGPTTRWISSSASHLQPPHTPYERTPIIGSGVGNTSATQEISPWYNELLQRYECLVNTGSASFFWYSDSPLGPWKGNTKVLGQSTGGEASNCVQCSVYVEGNTLYAFYLTASGATVISMATATMPTTESGVPVFVKNGVAYDNNAVSILESPWVMYVNGLYYMFTATNGSMGLATSSASSPAGFIATPFTAVAMPIKGYWFNIGSRYINRIGRPCILYENGLWVMYGHMLDTVDFGQSQIYRFTCRDRGLYPINWVQDSVQRPFAEQLHPAELDQLADVRLFKGVNDTWYFFWTGADNRANNFTIMAMPAKEPMLAFDGSEWVYTLNTPTDGAGPGYINPDIANVDVVDGQVPSRVGHMWDLAVQTTPANRVVTFPAACHHTKVKITNVTNNATAANLVHLAVNVAGDMITDSNAVVSMTRVGAVVTVVFRFPTDYDVNDFILVSGCTPVAYNTNSQAITSVSADKKTITYTLGADPGANTVVGAVARSVRPGESRQYKCRIVGIFVRD